MFEYLTKDCKPVATKSRFYSLSELRFIKDEAAKLPKEGIVELSSSPWRAQVLVTRNERRKKRMVGDFS